MGKYMALDLFKFTVTSLRKKSQIYFGSRITGLLRNSNKLQQSLNSFSSSCGDIPFWEGKSLPSEKNLKISATAF